MDRTLSVVVPVLNEAAAIGETLRAARAAVPGAEIVVADGGSTDGTANLAAPLADRVVTAPRGRAAQMNAGAAAATGDIFLFLHADTRLPAGAGAAIGQALEERGAGGPVWGRFDVTIRGRPKILKLVGAAMNARSRATGVATGDQAIFATRAAFGRVAGFPEIPIMEDVAMSKRLRALSAPACLTARVETSGRRWEANGPVRTILAMATMRLLYVAGVPPRRLAGLWARLKAR